jgi:hypothetical protein
MVDTRWGSDFGESLTMDSLRECKEEAGIEVILKAC